MILKTGTKVSRILSGSSRVTTKKLGQASDTTCRMTRETTSACKAAKMPRKFQLMLGGDIIVICTPPSEMSNAETPYDIPLYWLISNGLIIRIPI